MLMVFYGCTNFHPNFPEDRKQTQTVDYLLYIGTRTNLTDVETNMLLNVRKYCGIEYRNELPNVWIKARPCLIKSIKYLWAAVAMPVVSAVGFLIFYKKDRTSSYIAVVHFVTETLSLILGLYGAWFMSDSRLCFLGAFNKSYNIHAMVWAGALAAAVVHKVGIIYSLRLYLLHYYKSRNIYFQPPTPEEELKIYLKELRTLGITPKVHVDAVPSNPDKVNFTHLNNQIKKALQDVRIQVAQLHREDPLVSAILNSGKLGRLRDDKKKKQGSATSTSEPTLLKIAEMMKESSQYKLLKKRPSRDTEGSGRDDVEIILPEPGSRNDF